jgi:voltage-gated potassium channel
MAASQELTSRQKCLIIIGTLARAMVIGAVMVVLYYVLPLNRAIDERTVLLLTIGLVFIAALLAWRIRSILHAEHPGLRAIETIAVVVPLWILAFATTYYLASRANSATFSEPLTRTDALYFSVTVFATVGLGDITAKAQGARLVVTAQMLFDLVLLGFGARVFVSAVQFAKKRQ